MLLLVFHPESGSVHERQKFYFGIIIWVYNLIAANFDFHLLQIYYSFSVKGQTHNIGYFFLFLSFAALITV